MHSQVCFQQCTWLVVKDARPLLAELSQLLISVSSSMEMVPELPGIVCIYPRHLQMAFQNFQWKPFLLSKDHELRVHSGLLLEKMTWKRCHTMGLCNFPVEVISISLSVLGVWPLLSQFQGSTWYPKMSVEATASERCAENSEIPT